MCFQLLMCQEKIDLEHSHDSAAMPCLIDQPWYVYMLLGYCMPVYSLRREQPYNITLKHRPLCGFSNSLDQGTTNDMPIHFEPLGQAAECVPMPADFHSGFSVIPKWPRRDLSIFNTCWKFIAPLLNK